MRNGSTVAVDPAYLVRIERVGVEHQPDPATYDCQSCKEPWPCIPSLAYLRRYGGDTMQLSIDMWIHLEKACYVLPKAHPTYLFGRFLRWIGREA
jgi:hypothetical protein